jgi:ERCC4-related helicase
LFSRHPTGAGKTLIAAEVIRRKLPALKAATKAVLFMAPTNPLVAQVRQRLTKYVTAHDSSSKNSLTMRLGMVCMS